MRAAVMNYFVGSAYRTTSGYELKSFLDINTHEELWDWQQQHFINLYHVEAHYNGDAFGQVLHVYAFLYMPLLFCFLRPPLTLSMTLRLQFQMDRGTLLQHMRTTSGFRLIQRRSKNGTCSSYPRYALFADDCYAGVLS